MTAKPKFRVPISEQDPKIRSKNFNEVCLGYTLEEAVKEAGRCLRCPKPGCIKLCPVEIDIHHFVDLVAKGDIAQAASKLLEKNSLPAVCGRVCPQETQCEKGCLLGVKKEPVAIGKLERFAADWAREKHLSGGAAASAVVSGKNKGRMAVAGSGPAGLTCAGELAKMGYRVTVFESLHDTGGVLAYGIPEFRLPKAIVRYEVDQIRKLGVEIRTNVLVGRTLTLADLRKDGFKALFVGSGAGLPQFLNVPGEDLNGVYSANEYLTRVNLMKAPLFPEYFTPLKPAKKVVVAGGGNVAMDAARSALRMGAAGVTVVYRRSRAEMPARAEEIQHAVEEGVALKLLSSPVRVHGTNGQVSAVECVQMELGEPDQSGRRRPSPKPGSEFTVEADTLIVSIGNQPNPLIPRAAPELKIQKWGGIIVNEKFQTSLPWVFAGGDIVTGGATVIEAMGDGKKAARAMDEYVKNIAG